MKRIFSLLLVALLCALPLVGCKTAEAGGVKPPNEGGNEPSAEENGDEPSVEEDGEDQVEIDRIGGVSLAAFSAVLDAENMTPGIGQGDFIKQMGEYKYAEWEEPVSLSGVFYDGYDVCGYRSTGPYFGFQNHASRPLSDSLSKYCYTNSFYARMEMIGLSMPCGIGFADTMTDALAKIGIDEGRRNVILGDLEKIKAEENLALYQKENVSLWLKKDVVTVQADGTVDKKDGYALTYRETSPIVRGDGEPGTVIREVRLRFLAGGALSEIYFSVQEDYV